MRPEKRFGLLLPVLIAFNVLLGWPLQNASAQILHYRSFEIAVADIPRFLEAHRAAVDHLLNESWGRDAGGVGSGSGAGYASGGNGRDAGYMSGLGGESDEVRSVVQDEARSERAREETQAAKPNPPFVWHGLMRRSPVKGATHTTLISIVMYPDMEAYLADQQRDKWYSSQAAGLESSSFWMETVNSSVREETRIQSDIHFGNLPWESGFTFDGLEIDVPTRKVKRTVWREELLEPLRHAAGAAERCGSASMVRVSFKIVPEKAPVGGSKPLSSFYYDNRSPLMDLRLIFGFENESQLETFKASGPGCDAYPVQEDWLRPVLKRARLVRTVSQVTLGQIRDGRFIYTPKSFGSAPDSVQIP